MAHAWRLFTIQLLVVLTNPVRSQHTTTQGCACEQTWSYQGTTISDYCGNPDNDPNGDWCMVVDQTCQGTNWGTCAHACSVTALDPCRYARDGECDNPTYCTGACSDYFDCQIAREADLNCADCTAGGGEFASGRPLVPSRVAHGSA